MKTDARTRTTCGLLLAVVWLAPIHAASAYCGLDERFAPATESVLPPRPVVYFFDQSGTPEAELRFRAKTRFGAPVRLNVERVSRDRPYSVYRIAVASDRGFFIEVRQLIHRGKRLVESSEPFATAKYGVEIDRARLGRRASVVRVEGQSKVRFLYGSCSWQSTRNLRLNMSPAAVRIEWASSAEEYAKGHRASRILPMSEKRGDTVELGYVKCVGQTFDWGGQTAFVGVTALHEDGTETPPESVAVVEPVPLEPEQEPAPSAE